MADEQPPQRDEREPRPPGSPPQRDEREPGFDQILERLRYVVSCLEQGNLSLEQSLMAFEEGVRLSRRGSEILDAAERRVEILVKGEDGQPRPQPFGNGGDGDGRP